ncbi:tetratricopeptide repeat-containing serine protease family protein [Ideonella sp.]|uniref:tetratricopeptide repeat-containing serine protease family protein n=1 Tax=Ideonella sp. TaxID=1929293 RepID=UPI002B48E0D9|nr:tetratricopeptide repeat-containing serine protease family protein [Ideonella sp.]HJV72097.1 tetratricopeptide repeat-containing serine protease family protein [Ideonella sp.]
MKPLSAPSLCLALWLAAAAPCSAAIAPSAFVQLGASVLRIEVLQSRGGYGLGSGVVVAPDKVVTNCHVTRDAREVHVLRGAARWLADAQASDVEHDLCVLRVPTMTASTVRLGRSGGLSIGQAVMALGYSGGMGIQSSEGTIVALHKLDGSQVAQSSNWFSSGASGGGLFDDKLRLVGILTFRLRGGDAHYFAAPVEWLQPLLADESAYRAVMPAGSASRSYWEQPPQDQPNFLKAAVLEHESRWDELESLAFNWTRVDADDAEPWYLHGLALDALHRLPESQRALERALALAPAWREAWFRLGLVYLHQGLRDRALQAQAQLETLQSDFARDLLHAIESR